LVPGEKKLFCLCKIRKNFERWKNNFEKQRRVKIIIMNIGLLGEKIGMTQILTSKGENIPVTAILVGSNTVTQVKTLEKDGYNALQLA